MAPLVGSRHGIDLNRGRRSRMGRVLALAFALAAGGSGAATAQPSVSEAQAVPATIGAARQFDFTSAVNGKTYRVTVATPWAPPPQGGYPVVYVLDGGAYFG